MIKNKFHHKKNYYIYSATNGKLPKLFNENTLKQIFKLMKQSNVIRD